MGEAKIDKTTGAVIVPINGTVRFKPPSGDRLIRGHLRQGRGHGVRPAGPARPQDPGAHRSGQSGVTDLTITFDPDNTRVVYPVSVEFDYLQLENVIRRAVPTASVKVIPGVGQVIILTGYVTRPEDSDIITRIASPRPSGATSTTW